MPSITRRKLSGLLCAAVLAATWGGTPSAGVADELKASLRAAVTTIDPHFESATQNQALARHIFEPLILQGPHQELLPKLAESWSLIDDTTWEFKLRPDVKFHDGVDFTAEDVKFSIERLPSIIDSPSSLVRYVQPITAVEIVDPLTIRLKTEGPFPLLPVYMSGFVIIAKHAAEGKTTQDFNFGTAAIGTGPFRFVGWSPGQSVTLERYDDYWGEKPRWEKVHLNFVSNDATRMAQLLAGDADFIDQVPPSYAKQLERGDVARVTTVPSFRFMFLGLNQTADGVVQFADKSGAPLAANPLLDVRVRKALAMAINKETITSRVMEGFGQPTNQLTLPEAGISPNLPAEWYDVEGAKALLAEAGFPNGFALKMIAPNDAYINDAQVAQAIAQMFTRIGIEVNLEVIPQTVMRGLMNSGNFAVFLWAQGGTTGEPAGSLDNLIYTFGPGGRGTGNRGKYSNSEIDVMIDEALRTNDNERRLSILVDAIDRSMNDFALLPLYHMNTIDAIRTGYSWESRVDTRFYAQDVN